MTHYATDCAIMLHVVRTFAYFVTHRYRVRMRTLESLIKRFQIQRSLKLIVSNIMNEIV